MIQRIQSVYLFLVFVFAIVFSVLPLAQFTIDASTVSLKLSNYQSFFNQTQLSASWLSIVVIVVWLAALLLTAFMTFQYKKRVLQIKLGKLNMLLHVLLVMVTFFFIDNLRSQIEGMEFSYGAGILFPVISLIFILMAIKGIRKDEALIRSADRIR